MVGIFRFRVLDSALLTPYERAITVGGIDLTKGNVGFLEGQRET